MSISIRYNSKVLPRFYYLIQSACKHKTKKFRWFFFISCLETFNKIFYVCKFHIEKNYKNFIRQHYINYLIFQRYKIFSFFFCSRILGNILKNHVWLYIFFFDKDFILVDSIHTKRIYENWQKSNKNRPRAALHCMQVHIYVQM